MNGIYRQPHSEAALATHYDRTLARWPIPYTSLRLPTRHGETHVLACGDPAAPPLILLHGSASSALVWLADMEPLSRSHHVLAVDIPGEAGRSEPVRFPWTDLSFADWLEGVLDALHLPDARFVGISLGAWAILRLATVRPERVRAGVLLAPSGVASISWWGLARLVACGMSGPWGPARLLRLLFAGTTPPQEVVEFLDLIRVHFRPRLGAPPLFDDDALRSLHMPLLVRVGEEDVLVRARATVDRFHRLVPAADAAVVRGQGHALRWSHEEILAFLERVDGRVPGHPGPTPAR